MRSGKGAGRLVGRPVLRRQQDKDALLWALAVYAGEVRGVLIEDATETLRTASRDLVEAVARQSPGDAEHIGRRCNAIHDAYLWNRMAPTDYLGEQRVDLRVEELRSFLQEKRFFLG